MSSKFSALYNWFRDASRTTVKKATANKYRKIAGRLVTEKPNFLYSQVQKW
jgi:hypothetical protein